MPLRMNTPMPDLSGASEWLNAQPDLASLIGRPVLVHFWSLSCHICHANMPTLARWRDQYGAHGLQVIAIHMPRSADETNVAHVRAVVKEMQITEPCAVDNQLTIKTAFAATYVPAYFLFDREGKLRARTGGELGLVVLEQALQHEFESDQQVMLAKPA